MPRILGVDPGSRATGFGVIEVVDHRCRYVASGCIRADGHEWPSRLRVIFDGLTDVIAEYRPDAAAVESVFMQRNADSALKLGQARGAALCALLTQSLAVHQYTPAQVKQAIVGHGRADKGQVQHMVKALLALPSTPQADAADALACAICHHHVGQTVSRLAAARRPPVLAGGAS